MNWKRIHLVIALGFALHSQAAIEANDSFGEGMKAYRDGEYATAAHAFGQSASEKPASGTLINLGLSEWRRGRPGLAVLAWEQSLWVDPRNDAARNDLQFARTVAQIESPELKWYEAASKWLPANAWAWLASGSLWLAVTLIMLPTILRWRKARWQQAIASVSLGVFLLSVPAQFGIVTRSRLGFVLEKNSPLLLTPTHEAETIMTLAAGEPARAVRIRGEFVFIRTQHGPGWVDRGQFGLICPTEN